MEFYTITSEEGQTIYDIAMQEYADYVGVYVLMKDNAVITDLNHNLAPGTKLLIRQSPDVNDKELMEHFRANKIKVNSRADA
ncbi:MAG: hypothetical protein R2800_09830 [Flavipsychrobacter sp.]